MRTRGKGLLLALCLLALQGSSAAQPKPVFPVPPTPPPGLSLSAGSATVTVKVNPAPSSTTHSLRDRFVTKETRLLASSDPEERRRAIDHAASEDTPESTAFLVHVWESRGPSTRHPRAYLSLARALAPRASDSKVRTVLTTMLTAAPPSALGAGVDPGLFELGRRTVAMGLAASGEPSALESLFAALRMSLASDAAAAALRTFPPRGRPKQGPQSRAVLALYESLGDLRALGAFLEAAHADDPEVRAAAIHAGGALGDGRMEPLARKALTDGSPTVRSAAAFTLVRLHAKDAAAVVEALLKDEYTLRAGIELAADVESPAVTKLLGAHAKNHPDLGLRAQAMLALAQGRAPEAARALAELADDRTGAALAGNALARSRASDAPRWLSGLALDASPERARIGLRAYALRVLLSGERSRDARIDARAAACAAKAEPRLRGACVFAHVLVAEGDPYLADADTVVRRVALSAILARRTTRQAGASDAVYARRAVERDPLARALLLELTGSLDGTSVPFPMSWLALRAEARGPDAPLALRLFTARAEPQDRDVVRQWVESPSGLVRGAVAAGLARRSDAESTGALVRLYDDADARVRRAAVRALGERLRLRPGESRAKALRDTLGFAGTWDPEAEVRAAAQDAQRPAPAAFAPGGATWLTAEPVAEGAQPEEQAGVLWDEHGSLHVVVFDRAGDATIAGTGHGPGDLFLSPRP